MISTKEEVVTGLSSESVALCHQLRVLDKTRLTKSSGEVGETTLEKIETLVLFTLGYQNIKAQQTIQRNYKKSF